MHLLTRAIGLMSGTSMDGVDIAFLETDGEGYVTPGPTAFRAYTDSERALLRHALHEAPSMAGRDDRTGVMGLADDVVTRAHIEAVESFLKAHQIGAKDVDLIGFHGQTVLHRPDERLTVQIGDGAVLAKRLGVPVIFDFRANDVAAGGQGAPLVPIYHQALFDAARQAGQRLDGVELPDTVAILNLGGVANVTIVRQGHYPLACDTGPANALLDDFMLERTGVALDTDGAMAARGTPNEAALATLLDHPFFAQKPPKSLDRNAFSRAAVDGLSTEDGAATLTAFTAHATATILAHVDEAPKLWVICGGGARNPTMLAMLADAVGAKVVMADALGWAADSIEAEAFAYLAVRSQKRLPQTFPTTTGVLAPMTGGRLAMP